MFEAFSRVISTYVVIVILVIVFRSFKLLLSFLLFLLEFNSVLVKDDLEESFREDGLSLQPGGLGLTGAQTPSKLATVLF